MEELRIGRAVVVNDGAFLALQNAESDPKQNHRGRWELPGGAAEEGESRLEAVRREIREETGMGVEYVRELDRIDVMEDGTNYACRFFLFRAGSREVELTGEHQEYRWVPVRRERIRDLDWYYHAACGAPLLEKLEDELA